MSGIAVRRLRQHVLMLVLYGTALTTALVLSNQDEGLRYAVCATASGVPTGDLTMDGRSLPLGLGRIITPLGEYEVY